MLENDDEGRIASLEKIDPKLAKELKELIPILYAPDGEILDGFHRQDVDPRWSKREVTSAVSPLQKAVVKLIANNNRRRPTREERRENLRDFFLALKSEKKPDGSDYLNTEIFQILHEVAHLSLHYIRELLPEYTGPQKPKTHPPRVVKKEEAEKAPLTESSKDRAPIPESLARELVRDTESSIEPLSYELSREEKELERSVWMPKFEGERSPEEFVKLEYSRRPEVPDRFMLVALKNKRVVGEEAQELIRQYKPPPKEFKIAECPVCLTPLRKEDWLRAYKMAKEVNKERAELLKSLFDKGMFPSGFKIEE